mgnify:CR=1 FL=1
MAGESEKETLLKSRIGKSVFESVLSPNAVEKAIGVTFTSLFVGSLILMTAPIAIDLAKKYAFKHTGARTRGGKSSDIYEVFRKILEE